MSIVSILRNLFRKKASKPKESTNIVDSVVKSKILYKELIKRCHPDKNKGNEEIAQKYTSEINNFRYNYRELMRIKSELDNI